jgi:hypothetical protein
LLPAAVRDEAIDGALRAQPVQEDDLLRLRNHMHDHQMARPPARCQFEQRGERQPNLLAVCDNRMIPLADLPAGVGENQIRTTQFLEHRARSTRDRARRGVVEKIGIEPSRKFEVVGPGTLAARDLFADIRSDNA